jgi:pilus assembly protein CpaF
VLCKRNIVVSGGTGSGKTTFLNVLAALVPEHERVVVLEDARELRIHHEHVVMLETRAPDARGKNAVTMRDLFKASLRLRPDRIVLGEIRGGEALELIQAMTSGHGGCLATVHATYPNDALHRLETLALMSGVELPLVALRAQLASAVDVIVQTERLRSGRRVVTHVTEVLGVDPARGYETRDLFSFVRTRACDDGTEAAELVPTGALPACLPLLSSHDLPLPLAMAVAARDAGHRF